MHPLLSAALMKSEGHQVQIAGKACDVGKEGVYGVTEYYVGVSSCTEWIRSQVSWPEAEWYSYDD